MSNYTDFASSTTLAGETTTVIPPPPGVTVDFDHPRQQKVMEHYLIFGIGGTVAFIALCQRFYTKIYLSKGLQIDDVFMFLGWAASVITQAMLVAEGGMCAHAWEMPPSRFERYSVTVYVTAPVFMLCNGFTKLSLLTFYLHLSPQRWFRLCVCISIIIVSLYTACITLLMLFRCSPVRKAYDLAMVGAGACLDVGVLYIATAVSNILTDVILFLLPLPMIFTLRMRMAQKVVAVLIFAIGSITIATSITRLVLLPTMLTSVDPSWDAAPANLWTFLEGNLFVICGSMPTLRKFFRHFAQKFFLGTSSHPSSYGGIGAGGGGAGGARGAAALSSSSAAASSSPYANLPSNITNKSSCHQTQYDQLTDENEMHSFHSYGKQKVEIFESGCTAVVVVAAGDRDRDNTDDMSDKAIWQTRTFTIQRE